MLEYSGMLVDSLMLLLQLVPHNGTLLLVSDVANQYSEYYCISFSSSEMDLKELAGIVPMSGPL